MIRSGDGAAAKHADLQATVSSDIMPVTEGQRKDPAPEGEAARRRTWRLRVAIPLILAAGAVFLSVDWTKRFATDVSLLLPGSDEENVPARLLERVREEEERLVLGALNPPRNGWNGRREEAASAAMDSLRATGLFSKVAEGAGPSDPEAVAAAVYEARLDFLLPHWAEEAGLAEAGPDPARWAEAIVASFEEFLTRPEATAMGDLLPADPFPLAAYMERTAPLTLAADEAGPVLFWARQIARPFEPEGQAPVLKALADAEEAASSILPGTSLQEASVAAFAAESERRIRKEITLLNTFAILLVALAVMFFLRRRILLLHLLVIAACSVAGGLGAALLFFPVVHILSLVVGGLLVGIAVDYGIHGLLHRPSSRTGGYGQSLRDVRKPLLASALSTAGGFSVLLFADLLLLRQIGAFVAGGLLTALLATWLYLPLWSRPEEVARLAAPAAHRTAPGWLVPGGLILFLLPLAGWLRLDWRDDLRELQPPMPERWEADAEVRRWFSHGQEQVAWLCYGESGEEARHALGVFESAWREAGGETKDLVSLAPWIATPEASEATRSLFRRMPEFEEVLKDRLRSSGFAAEAFDPFFAKLREWLSPQNPDFDERLLEVAAALDGPAGMLLHGGRGAWWFLASAPEEDLPPDWLPPARSVSTAQLETLNDLFAQYRQAAWRLSGFGFALISCGVLLAYGPAAGLSALLLPVLAWTWGMGLVTALASPLNLFHLLGGFVGFCVALDYGLFFRHARESGSGPPLSIRLSAATTLSAFGVLACGSIPAVAALGSSVFAVVLGALFGVEAAVLFPSKQQDE